MEKQHENKAQKMEIFISSGVQNRLLGEKSCEQGLGVDRSLTNLEEGYSRVEGQVD